MVPACCQATCDGNHATSDIEAQGFAYTTGTLGGFIGLVLRKELLGMLVQDEPSGLNGNHVDSIVSILAPNLTQKLIETARNRLPTLSVTAVSSLPEALPVSLQGGPCDPSELAEELHCFLGSHDLVSAADARTNLKKVAAQISMSHPWQRWLCAGCALLLPSDAVLVLCNMASFIILVAHKLSITSKSDLTGGSSVFLSDGHSSLSGQQVPDDHANAMRCRKRIFALERELRVREQAASDRETFERAEWQRSEARLMDINKQLEGKLKTRTEELRRAGQKVIEVQRCLDDLRSQLSDKKKEIMQLNYYIEKGLEMQRHNHAREQEHSRAVLRHAARESISRAHSKNRADKLEKYVKGQDVAQLLRHPHPHPDSDNTDDMVVQLEDQFMQLVHRRKKQYDVALEDFDHKIEKKQQEYNNICRKVQQTSPTAHKANLSGSWTLVPPSHEHLEIHSGTSAQP